MVIKNAFNGGGRRGKDPDHQVFHGSILISHGFCSLFCGSDDSPGFGREINLCTGTDLRKAGNHGIQFGQDEVAVNTHFPKEGRDQPAILID